MASSDFDKPPSGMINITGKKARAEPTDSKMVESNLSKTQQGGKGEKSTASPMSGTGSTVPVIPSNYSFDLSLLFGLYGAGNLSYQFATSPNGSMMPFGLFPFGLAVPSVPVQQAPTNIVNTSEIAGLPLQTSSQHTSATIKRSAEKLPKSTIPPSLKIQCTSKNLEPNRRKMPSPAIIRSESTKTLSADSGFTFRSSSNSNIATKNNPYIQKPVTLSTAMKVPNVKNKPSGSSMRTDDLTKKPRQQHQTQSHTHKVDTSNNLALMQSSSFRDAEAAAILLGLRHGVSNIVTQVGNTDPQHVVNPNPTSRTKAHFSECNTQNTIHHTFPAKPVITTTVRKFSTSTASHSQTPLKGNHSAMLATDVGKHIEPNKAIVHRPISSTIAKEPTLKSKCQSNYADGTKVSLHSCSCGVECTRQNEHNVQQDNGGFNFKKIICKKFTQSSDKSNERQIQDLQRQNEKIVSDAINTYKPRPNFHSLHNSPRENSRVISPLKVTKSKSKCGEKHSTTTIKQKETKSLNSGVSQPTTVKKTVISSVHSASISKSHTSAATSHLQPHKANHPSLLVSATEPKISNTAPSFSELRQISARFSGSRQNFGESLQSNKIKQMLPKSSTQSSNLYRLRKSGMGDSNDSLHSIGSNDDDKQEQSGDESETSCSSSEESNVDSDVSDHKETASNLGSSDSFTKQRMPATSRSTFTLSRPKFTPGLQTLGQCSSMKDITGNVKGHTNSKVKIRRPTFTFSSGNIQSDYGQDSGKMKRTENVPELKFDDKDCSDQSFKSKFIRALENPDSKKGLAVDEKSLRALLGEATYFYHNNKKYVLKRALTKSKPKEGFIADVDRTDGNLVSIKNICKGDNIVGERLSNIEPRLSVTATKKSDHQNDEKIKSKRFKTHKIDFTDKRLDLLEKSPKSKIKITVSDTHNKRHRRTHEIDNLVFEGAGGLTPMPDISLRDSDVFSNIKLRRREAAKRGIKETDKAISKLQKLAKRNKLKRKSLRIKTHKRALLNSIAKHTFDRKLRKRRKHSYHKSRSTFLNSSCVRISAGADKPHLDARAYTSDKFCNTSITDAHPSESTIYTAAPESKQSLVNEVSNCDPGIVNEVVDNDADMSSRDNFTNTGYTILLSGACIDNKYLSSNVSPANEQQEDCLHQTSQGVKQLEHVSCDDRGLDTKDCSDVTNLISDNAPSKCYDRRKRIPKSASKATKSYKFGSTQRRRYNFSILSNFDAPSAITLDSVFGDLQPSYSVKNQKTSWEIGTCAQDTKQKIQRKLWQNMTLDMFSNR